MSQRETAACDSRAVLDLAMYLGYHLQVSGAEIYRVEESVMHLLNAYGVPGDVFAIPNCLIVTVHPVSGKTMTRMRRVPTAVRDIDAIERYNGVCRRICAAPPPPEKATEMVRAEKNQHRRYSPVMLCGGYFLTTAAFAVFYGGNLTDGILAGLCGILTGLLLDFLTRLQVNLFFKNITAAFWIAIVSQTLAYFQVIRYADAVAIGALMLLVPGLSFTDSMRDIIYGDTLSGIYRLAQVLLTAVALLLGTGAAIHLSHVVWDSVSIGSSVAGIGHSVSYPGWVQCLAGALSCVGFSVVFNIRFPGLFICAAGGGLSWAAYLTAVSLGMGELTANFAAAVCISLYAEIMARIRKFPASSYLVIALLPLVPGAGIYYTVEYLLHGETGRSAAQLMHTGAIAGMLAVGVLMVSTLFRMWSTAKQLKREASDPIEK